MSVVLCPVPVGGCYFNTYEAQSEVGKAIYTEPPLCLLKSPSDITEINTR